MINPKCRDFDGLIQPISLLVPILNDRFTGRSSSTCFSDVVYRSSLYRWPLRHQPTSQLPLTMRLDPRGDHQCGRQCRKCNERKQNLAWTDRRVVRPVLRNGTIKQSAGNTINKWGQQSERALYREKRNRANTAAETGEKNVQSWPTTRTRMLGRRASLAFGCRRLVGIQSARNPRQTDFEVSRFGDSRD